jgi:hypothetical protein
MQFVLKILQRHLDNERKWLSYERIAVDLKTKEGVRMAKERIPQLEQAIAKLKIVTVATKTERKVSVEQLNLFQNGQVQR